MFKQNQCSAFTQTNYNIKIYIHPNNITNGYNQPTNHHPNQGNITNGISPPKRKQSLHQNTQMVKIKRRYDRRGAAEMRAINNERKKQGLEPLKRKRKKTMRTYTYSGKYVGMNGGKTRTFTNAHIQDLMDNTCSEYVDDDGNATGKKRKQYQGKYPQWFEQVKKHMQASQYGSWSENGEDDDVNDGALEKNLDNKGKSLCV